VQQLQEKEQRVKELLSPYYQENIVLFGSPDSYYRARAEFRIWHEGDACYYAMGSIDKKSAIIIEECPKVIKAIEKRMWKLLEQINLSIEILKHRLFAVEFLATLTDEVLVTMIYHRKLDEAWSHDAKTLEQKLSCKIIGRSRKQKIVLSDEYVTEKLDIEGNEYLYRQYEGSFTQPNPIVNIKMIAWAEKHLKKIGYGDFLESYCGLGNFTIPLSKYFKKVLATEISKRSIKAALENCKLNHIENINFIRLSSEEMTEALGKKREFNRLKGIEMDNYKFSAVLVDPPRAGLDDATINLISKIEHILYISCNPETLARDLKRLVSTHIVKDIAIFDQFPHTEHTECGVFLNKR
jgi:tRNA (uracil-5-)-methyltransferase